MSQPGRAVERTRDHLEPRVRRPGLVRWAFHREVTLAHAAYWRGCHGPVSASLAVALYPLWVAVTLPLAFLLGLAKVALLGAIMTVIAVAASRVAVPHAARVRPRR